jgi:hypothetical protein
MDPNFDVLKFNFIVNSPQNILDLLIIQKKVVK